jgi:hypothetical protein
MFPASDSAFQTMDRELLLEFLAELFNATHTTDTTDAFQRVVQTFCDELRPWLTPMDVPPEPRAVFSLFEDCNIDEATDITTVQLSPEGRAFFRAWVRRQAVQTETGGRSGPQWGH